MADARSCACGIAVTSLTLSDRLDVLSLRQDGSGDLGRRELAAAVQTLGFDCTAAEIDKLFRAIDVDGTGEITYETLNKVLREQPTDSPPQAKLRRSKAEGGPARVGAQAPPGAKLAALSSSVGRQEHLDGRAELTAVLEALRDALLAHGMEVIDLFREMDMNGDGRISHEEFRGAMGFLGLDQQPGFVDALLGRLDSGRSGTIEYRELHEWLAAPNPSASAAAGVPTSGERLSDALARRAPPTEVQRKSKLGISKGLLSGTGGAGPSWGEDELGDTAPGESAPSVQELIRKELARKWLRVKDLFVAWECAYCLPPALLPCAVLPSELVPSPAIRHSWRRRVPPHDPAAAPTATA